MARRTVPSPIIDHLEPVGPGAWDVPGREQPFYRVEIDGHVARCPCPDYTYRRRACKHIRAVWAYLAGAPGPAARGGPAFDDVPLPDVPPEDLDVDDVEMPSLEGELVAAFVEPPAIVPAPASPPAPGEAHAGVMRAWWGRRRTAAA